MQMARHSAMLPRLRIHSLCHTCHHPPFISRTEPQPPAEPLPHTPRPFRLPGRQPSVLSPAFHTCRSCSQSSPVPTGVQATRPAGRAEPAGSVGTWGRILRAGHDSRHRPRPSDSEGSKGPQAGRRRVKRENHYRQYIQLVSQTRQKDVNYSRSRNVQKKRKRKRMSPETSRSNIWAPSEWPRPMPAPEATRIHTEQKSKQKHAAIPPTPWGQGTQLQMTASGKRENRRRPTVGSRQSRQEPSGRRADERRGGTNLQDTRTRRPPEREHAAQVSPPPVTSHREVGSPRGEAPGEA